MPLSAIEITDERIDYLAKQLECIFDDKRKDILKSLKTINIQACPGSGKTTLIAAKLILLAQQWQHKYQGICVLSHTNVAKDEIIKRIKQSQNPEAQNLLSYPHFIGTIQEFIDKYIALPYIKNKYGFSRFIDKEDERYNIASSNADINDLCKSLYYKCGKASYDEIKEYLGGLFYSEYPKKLAFYAKNFELKEYHDKTKTYLKLYKLKCETIEKGLYQYRDMFSFSERILLESNCGKYLQKRFPLVLIDEMQDTAKYQDNILQQIFPTQSGELQTSVIQRFGDPDQAIYDAMNDGANESYNNMKRDNMDFVIDKSHRFHDDIANKIKGFSLNAVGLAEEKIRDTENTALRHSIILFDDKTITEVIKKFAEICKNEFKHKDFSELTIKAIGAVGENKQGEKNSKDELKVTIPSYYNGFKKDNSPKRFNPSKLIDAVYYVKSQNNGNVANNYKIISDAVLKLLRLSDKKDANGKYYTKISLKEYLLQKEQWHEFNKLMYRLLFPKQSIDKHGWKKFICKLCEILNITNGINDYLEFSEEAPQSIGVQSQEKNSINKIQFENINIDVSTIHIVKGETHDATLVLETFFNDYDIKSVLDYLCNPSKKRKSCGSRKIKFMRQLYVAMSRPRSLLCLAMYKNHVNDEQKQSLKNIGWLIEEI